MVHSDLRRTLGGLAADRLAGIRVYIETRKR